MKLTQLSILAAALLTVGTGPAHAAQVRVDAGVTSGDVSGFMYRQIPQGLDGDTHSRSGYTGLKASASATFDALPGVVFGLDAMTSTGGADVSDLGAAAGYVLHLMPDLTLTPGIEYGYQRVGDESYTRAAGTLSVAYAISSRVIAFASGAIGKTNSARDMLAQREHGDYHSGGVGLTYMPAPGNALTLAYTKQTTQTASLGLLGDQYMRDRAPTITYARAF